MTERMIVAITLSEKEQKLARKIANKQHRSLSNWLATLIKQAIEAEKENS